MIHNKQKYSIRKSAFTLIELIVIITILAILWTIAFISIQWYSAQARDSKRLSDIQNIKKSLELFSLNTWKYPLADDYFTVSYSWEQARHQGTVWYQVTTNLSRNLAKKPTDPLTWLEYTYSTTHSQTEYEVLGLYESDLVTGVPVPLLAVPVPTYANSQDYPKIEWTYNQIYVKTPNFYVPTPSIINWNLFENTDLINTLDLIQSQVTTGWDNIPWVSTWWLNITLNAFTWTIDEDSSNQDKIDLIEIIQNTYSWSILEDKEPYNIIIPLTDTPDIIDFVNTTILNITQPTDDNYYCDPSTKPTNGWHYTYITGTPIDENQIYIKDAENCWYTCVEWWFGNDCDITYTEDSCFTFALINSNSEYEITWFNTTLCPWITSLVIPDTYNSKPITSIWNNAFSLKWEHLDNVILSNNLKNIWNRGFYNIWFENLVIPDSVESIWFRAFARNSSFYWTYFNNVILWDWLTSLWDEAFKRNKIKKLDIWNWLTSINNTQFANAFRWSLEELTLWNSLTNIWYGTFSSNNLTTLNIPDNITTIWESAFASNNIETLHIWSWITTLENNVFYDNSLTSLIIPNNVITIKNSTFSLAIENLSSLSLSENLTSIWYMAFYNIWTEELIIPDSVQTIEDRAFGRNESFNWTYFNNVILWNWLTSLWEDVFKRNKIKNLSTWNWITSITQTEFWNAFRWSLEELTLWNSLTNIWYGVFNGNKLTSLNIPNNVTTIWGSAFSYNNISTLHIWAWITTLEDNVFNNNNLGNICIPNNVSNIWFHSFVNNNINYVTLWIWCTYNEDYSFDEWVIITRGSCSEESTHTCDQTTKPEDNGHINYVTWNPTEVNQAYTQNASDCWYSCIAPYTWANCDMYPTDPLLDCENSSWYYQTVVDRFNNYHERCGKTSWLLYRSDAIDDMWEVAALQSFQDWIVDTCWAQTMTECNSNMFCEAWDTYIPGTSLCRENN